jgi:hypothetical protein
LLSGAIVSLLACAADLALMASPPSNLLAAAKH